MNTLCTLCTWRKRCALHALCTLYALSHIHTRNTPTRITTRTTPIARLVRAPVEAQLPEAEIQLPQGGGGKPPRNMCLLCG
jgi:hypothetical protein